MKLALRQSRIAHGFFGADSVWLHVHSARLHVHSAMLPRAFYLLRARFPTYDQLWADP